MLNKVYCRAIWGCGASDGYSSAGQHLYTLPVLLVILPLLIALFGTIANRYSVLAPHFQQIWWGLFIVLVAADLFFFSNIYTSSKIILWLYRAIIVGNIATAAFGLMTDFLTMSRSTHK